MASLRRTGVSLQKIRETVRLLTAEYGQEWHSLWLISDGKDIQLVREDRIVETLTGPTGGQLAFAVVAMGVAQDAVKKDLAGMARAEFLPSRYRGEIVPYRTAKLGGG